MKVGVSEWSLHQNFGRMVENPKPLTVMEYLDLAAGWGVNGVQIESIPEDAGALAAIRAKAESLGMYIEIEAGGLKPERIRKKLEAAKVLGAKVLRTFPALHRYKKDLPLGAQIRQGIENLKEIARDAERLGILVGVENHQHYIRDKVEDQDIRGPELAAMLAEVESPFIGVCLDTGNCLGYLDDPMETAMLLAPRTVTVHLKDYRIKRTMRGAEFAGCVLGQGVIDLPAILRLLRAVSPLKDGLCLNIESAVERVQLPFLDPEFWDGYGARDAERLPDFLRLIRDHGEPPESDFMMPVELGKSLDTVLAHEKDCNARSIAYTRELLAKL